jgi:hypothetical protein
VGRTWGEGEAVRGETAVVEALDFPLKDWWVGGWLVGEGLLWAGLRAACSSYGLKCPLLYPCAFPA